MASKTHKREFTEFMGVNIKSDAIALNPVFASGGKNALYGQRGQIEKRPGVMKACKANISSVEGFSGRGFMKFTKVDILDGGETEVMVGFDYVASSNNYHLSEVSFTTFDINYAGAGTPEVSYLYDIALDRMVMRIYVNASEVGSLTVEVADTLATVKTFVDALADFTATNNGSVNNEAYRLPTINRVEITDGIISITVIEGSKIDYFQFNISALSSTGYMPSHVSINGNLYFSISENVYKYDGRYYYGAGLNKPSTSYFGATTGGSMALGDYTYAYRGKFVDPSGNISYSGIKYVTRTIGGANNAALMSYQHIPSAPNRPNTMILDITGSGTSNVIPCTNNDDVAVKDIVFIYDTVNYTSVRATVVAQSVGSITIDQSIVFTATSSITLQYSIEIYRTTATGGGANDSGPFYFIAETTPVISGVGVGLYLDVDADSTIVENTTLDNNRQWAEEFPTGSILSKFQNSLIISGDKTQPSVVHFSDQSGTEQFDLSVNNFTVDGTVKAIGSTKEQLAVFKEYNTDVLTGDLQGFAVRVDRADDHIGCVSHESIQRIDDGMLYFLSAKGPWQMVNGQIGPLGSHQTKSGKNVSRLEPYFVEKLPPYYLSNTDRKNKMFERSKSGHWKSRNLYFLCIPVEYGNTPSQAEPESETWVYDYEKGSWLPVWDIVAPNVGMHDFGDEFYYMNRSSNAEHTGHIYKFHTTGTTQDYVDAKYNDSSGFDSVDFEYKFAWIHFGSPGLFKKFLRVNLFAHELIQNTTYDIDIETEHNFIEGTAYTNISDISVTVGRNKKIKLASMKSRAMRLILKNNSYLQNVSINGWTIEAADCYKKAMKE